MFQIGNKTYAHADSTTKVIPIEGPNVNQAFRCKSAQSIKLAPNAKAVALQGASGAPVSIVVAETEPDWEVALSAAEEIIDLSKWLGPGAVRVACRVEVTWARTGLSAYTYAIPLTYITKGLGVESDSGTAPKGTIGGIGTDILLDDVSILRRPEEVS
jgi:hypothetical protein